MERFAIARFYPTLAFFDVFVADLQLLTDAREMI